MLVVVEPPDAVRASRLQVVVGLKPSHEHQVSLEDLVNESLVVIDAIEADLAHAVERNEEVELVTSSVVDSLVGSERVQKVLFDLTEGICCALVLRIGGLSNNQ